MGLGLCRLVVPSPPTRGGSALLRAYKYRSKVSAKDHVQVYKIKGLNVLHATLTGGVASEGGFLRSRLVSTLSSQVMSVA